VYGCEISSSLVAGKKVCALPRVTVKIQPMQLAGKLAVKTI